MAGYKDLEVWKLGKRLAALAYEYTEGLPASERFGISTQIQRAAVSVPCNIAEGYARRNPADYCRFLRIAKGSLNELETLLLIAADLGYPDPSTDLVRAVPALGSKLSNLIDRIGSGTIREQLEAYSAHAENN